MNLKSRLFGAPWENRNPEVRASAVAESQDPALMRVIGEIAEHDDSPTVRLAALERLDTEAFWLDARLRESDPRILAAADRFLRKAVLRPAEERLAAARLRWFERIDDPELTRRLASRAPDLALRRAALARIDAPGFLGDRVLDEPDDETALALIERIEQESTLERIGQALRRRSKRRARAVEARLSRLRTARGADDGATAASAMRVVEAIEALARGHHDGPAAERLAELEARWRRIEAPGEALQVRFDGAREIVRRALSGPRRDAATRPNTAEAPAADGAASADRGLEQVERRITAAGDPAALGPREAGELLAAFDRAWNAIGQPSAGDEAVRERLLPKLRLLQKRRQAAGTPRREPSTEREATAPPDWDRALDEVAGQLESGDIAGAQSTLRDLRSRYDRLDRRQRPRRTGGRLSRLEGRLREMRNYEHWSNNQIRDELITRVEQLIAEDPHPDAVTAELKAARAEWQRLEDLEVLPGDKRRHAAPPQQWRRFQAACQAAFEKARPFFEKRSQVQAENLAHLEAFIERGRSVAEDDGSELDTLRQFQRKARQAIRRLDDLPPGSRSAAAARLRELMDRLSERIDEAFDHVEMAKRRLIKEARELEHESDLETAIARAKALQARWQEAGSARRRIEQALWKEFREPIDPLFERLRSEQSERRQQQAAEIEALERSCERAEALAEVDAEELETAEGRMRSLVAEWAEAGRKPVSLNERFEKARKRLQSRLEDRRRARRRSALERLDALARTIQALARARLDGERLDRLVGELPEEAPADTTEGRMLEVARELADPERELADLEQRLADNASKARQVLIEMEFLAGLESPPQDRDARMRFQVERLASRMSERGDQPALSDELAVLRDRWYASFPHPADTAEAMTRRFDRCQNVLESMSGTE